MIKRRNIEADYLSGNTPLKDFYAFSPSQPNFESIIEVRKKYPHPRKLLQESILEQYKGINLSDRTSHNITALADSNTFTITTGHQLCLFGGPMYTIYKTIHAIKLATHLKAAFPKYNFVPIFWLASEDHDFEEINHFYLSFDKKYSYDAAFKSAVGRHELTTHITELYPASHAKTLANFYTPGKTLKRAFREHWNYLFGEHGLVIVDGDCPKLKASFAPVMKADILSRQNYAAITETSRQLHLLGYKSQIHPREINLFYLTEQERSRIIAVDDDAYTTSSKNISWNRKTLITELANHPERFSPNVALRPLYQEHLLPNLAYVGGWGEIKYWLQLKKAFEVNNIPFPLLVPRMSATLFSGAETSAIHQLGLQPDMFDKPLQELRNIYLAQLWDEEPFWRRKDKLHKEIAKLGAFVEKTEVTLLRSLYAAEAQLNRKLQRIIKKMRKIERRKRQSDFDLLEGLKSAISPDGKRQERTLNYHHWLDSVSEKQLINFLFEACTPLAYSPRHLTLPEATS